MKKARDNPLGGFKLKVVYSKGQLNSKGLFGMYPQFFQKTNEKNSTYLATMIPQVDLFSFIFWKNLKTPKRNFEIN